MKLELSVIADCLNLPVNTIERWVRQGRMPVRRSGSVCIFKKAVLEKWAKSHNIDFKLPPKNSTNDEKETDKTPDNDNSLTAAMKRGGIYHISGETVEAVLQKAAGSISCFSKDEQATLYERLLERESLTSTGIGKGVAIPHPRTPMSDENSPTVIATFFLDKPVDFRAIDDKPVSVMFIIVCPDVQSHLQLLSMISFCVRDDAFVSFLNTKPEPDAFFDRIDTIEQKLEKRH